MSPADPKHTSEYQTLEKSNPALFLTQQVRKLEPGKRRRASLDWVRTQVAKALVQRSLEAEAGDRKKNRVGSL